jgi:hypothetical protein
MMISGGKTEDLEKTLLQCDPVYHEPHLKPQETEPAFLRAETSV